MAIFNSYVSLPEGILYSQQKRGLEKVTMISFKKKNIQIKHQKFGMVILKQTKSGRGSNCQFFVGRIQTQTC